MYILIMLPAFHQPEKVIQTKIIYLSTSIKLLVIHLSSRSFFLPLFSCMFTPSLNYIVPHIPSSHTSTSKQHIFTGVQAPNLIALASSPCTFSTNAATRILWQIICKLKLQIGMCFQIPFKFSPDVY